MRNDPAPDRPRSPAKKTLRFDSRWGDDPSPPGPPRESKLLDQFRSWFAGPTECRRATRHPARTYVVWLGWWRRGEEEFFAATARLANISRGGALVVLQDPPPESQPVWICLGTPEPDECLAASALEIRRARRGECTVRLAFREPCPSRFLEAAVCGRTSDRPRLRHSGA